MKSLTFKQMKQIVDLLNEEWDLGKKISKAKGKTCAWIYLFEILEHSENIVVEQVNNKVIGICGYEKYYSKKYKFRKKFYCSLKNILMCSPLIKNKEAIYQYYQNYNYVPEELMNYFDGEITILIVDKCFRKKSIGKKMLFETFEMAKNDKIKHLQILTDESCNFNFYNNCGCKQIYETVVQYNDKEDGIEKAYIYEKEL